MRKLGFTLAEVLITLVIIGVIAAMTVPTLMNNTNAQEFRSALKKAVSGANQALTLHYALEGLGAQDYTNAESLVEGVFKTRMSIIDDEEWIKAASGAADDDASTCTGKVFTTADGVKFCVMNTFKGNLDTDAGEGENADPQSVPCNSYNTVPCTSDGSGWNMLVDVNGSKNPNRLTKTADQPRDRYTLTIYNQKVIPFGDAAQGVMFDKQVSAGSETQGS